MPDRKNPRNHRTSSPLRSVVTLAVVLGLTSSLGLARTVWGGPPAADAEAPAESGPEAEPAPDASGDLDADPTAEPVAADASATLPDASELPPVDTLPDESAASVPGASSMRARMESGMTELGELAVEARNDEDLVRATCVLDKQDRANDVMDLGTSELLVIRDPGTSDQARGFALEKLEAASGRIDKLVEDAKACSGREGPEDEVDITRNEADEPRTIPIWDPTAGLGDSPVPPPFDAGWPPFASPME
ncbi:hypothetical protein ENSA5_55900 [Enhygromyxa salina]|uniref:Uncharacterized protein n=1 Tax=Enhygromyxa salina TaxID=215803 RepID=A0A2S9XEN3_9BACT|nr:hypothetical protein [Enhygromyxa salina]PRP91324.1 hypothetical protein ENSA5_55900 [Enhygromyxa salina]